MLAGTLVFDGGDVGWFALKIVEDGLRVEASDASRWFRSCCCEIVADC
jgi:hypothetical protein